MEVGAKEAEKGRLLQVGNLSMSGSRSKASGKGEVTPRGEIYRNEKIAGIFTKEDGSSKIRK